MQNSKSLGNHIDETKDLIHKAVASVTQLKKEAEQAVDGADVVVGRARYASTNHMVQALDGLTYLKEMRGSIDQCRRLHDQGQYAAIAPHLKKQQALRPYFRRYSDIPVIDKVLTEVDDFQEDLLREIESEFKLSYGKVEDDKEFARHLTESAQLMDSIGEHAAHDLRKWFVAAKQEELEYFVLTVENQTVDRLPPRKVAEMEEAVAQAAQELEDLREKQREGETEAAGEQESDAAIEAAQAALREKQTEAESAAIEAAKTHAYNASMPKTLDDLCERYQWLEDELDTYTYTYMDIFPASWEVSEAFTHKCCMYLRGFVEGIIMATKPLNIELQAFMERTLEFEEFLSDRYAAAAAALAEAGADALISRTASSVGRPRTRSGSIRRTGSMVGRGSYQINWNGVISREVQRFAADLLPKKDEESAELGRPAAQSEATGVAGGSVLVPRLPRQSLDGDSIALPAAEPWDFRGDSQRFKTAAFESLLLCMSGEHFDALEEEADAIETAVKEIMRVQMGVSRRAFVKLQNFIRLPDQVKSVDLAGVLGAAELKGVQLDPYLHFRFLLLETHTPQDFETDEEFVEWFDRQASVFLSGLFWKLENIAESNQDKRTVQLANMDTFSIRDAFYEIQSSLERLKEILLRADEDPAEFVDVTKELEDDLECLYSQIDVSLAETADLDEDADTNQASNHILPLPFPLNVELYTTALLTIFDQEESMWGELKEEAEELLVVFKFWRPFLNINEAMHQIAMVRCYFLVYTACINAGEETERAPEALIAFERSVAELTKVSKTVKPTDESTRYELAVKMDILKSLEHRLLDYHQCFHEEHMETVRGEFDVFTAMKAGMNGLTGKVQQKMCDGEAVRFIQSSARKFYLRLSRAVDQETALGERERGEDAAGAPMHDDDDGPLAGMRDLADYLAEEGILKVVTVAKQFKAYHRKSGTAAVMQLTAEYQADVEKRLEPYTEVTADVANLLNATRNLLNTLVELYGEKAHVKFAHIMAPFQRLVKRELEMQHMKFDQLVEQCIKTDRWESINDQCLSASSVDIFTMLGQSLPMVMESGLLLIEENVTTLVQNVDGMIMKYAMHVLRSCGERAPLQKKREKKSEKLSSNMDNLRDKAAAKAAKKKHREASHAGKVIDRPDSAPEGGEEGEEEKEREKREKPQPSYAVISTEELCVRVNSLVHCTHNIRQLASRIAYELGDTEAYVDPLAPDFDPADRSAVDKVPLCGSIMVLESCTEQLLAFIGAKIIFHELENELLLGLYVPTPERGIRMDGALNALDEVMDILFAMLPDEETFKLVLGGIFTCFIEVMHKVLSQGGGQRKYADEDATLFVEDLESLESWFIARDENGDAQGLSVDVVEEATLSLHEVVGNLQFKAGK